jgi:hypothetical protein
MRVVVGFQVEATERDWIHAQAKAADMTVSRWLRRKLGFEGIIPDPRLGTKRAKKPRMFQPPLFVEAPAAASSATSTEPPPAKTGT